MSTLSKQKILIFLYSLIITNIWLTPLFIGSDAFKYRVVIGNLLSILCIVFNLYKEKIEFKKFKKYKLLYLVLISIVGISFLANGIYFRVLGYISIALSISVVLPALHLSIRIDSNEDYPELIAKGILFSFVIFMFLSVLSGPVLTIKKIYSSFTGNPNLLSGFTIVVTSASLYLIYKKILKNEKFYGLLISLYTAIVLTIFAQARTALLAILAQLIFVVVILMPYLSCQVKSKKFNIKEIFISVFVGIVIFFLVATSLFLTLSYVKQGIAKVAPKIQISESEKIEKSGLIDDFDIVGKRMVKGISEKSGDKFTSGRLGIWNDFLLNLKFIGHAKEGRNLVVKDRKYKSTNAHNVYLQVAYSSGIISGIAMIILMLIVIKDSFIIFFKGFKTGEYNPSDVFAIIASIVFFVFSITSGGYMIYTYYPSTLFWILLYRFSTKNEV